MRTYRILAINGGGIRGLIPAIMLRHLEAATRRPIHELFDLVVGTSTGGILALGLTTPKEYDSTPKFSAGDLVVAATVGSVLVNYALGQHWRKIVAARLLAASPGSPVKPPTRGGE
jgi:uncharacterized protein